MVDHAGDFVFKEADLFGAVGGFELVVAQCAHRQHVPFLSIHFPDTELDLNKVVRVGEGVHGERNPVANDAFERIAPAVDRWSHMVDDDTAGACGFS